MILDDAAAPEAQKASTSNAERELIPDYVRQIPVTPVAVLDKSIPLKDIVDLPKLP